MTLMVTMNSFRPLPNWGSNVAGSVGTTTLRLPAGPEAFAAAAVVGGAGLTGGTAPGLAGTGVAAGVGAAAPVWACGADGPQAAKRASAAGASRLPRNARRVVIS